MYLQPKVGQNYLIRPYTWINISKEESKTTEERKDISIEISKIYNDEYGELIIEGIVNVKSDQKVYGTQISEGTYKNIILSKRYLSTKL